MISYTTNVASCRPGLHIRNSGIQFIIAAEIIVTGLAALRGATSQDRGPVKMVNDSLKSV